MKGKLAYFSLVLAILLLVGVAAVLTSILLDMPPPDSRDTDIGAAKEISQSAGKPSIVAKLDAEVYLPPVAPSSPPPPKPDLVGSAGTAASVSQKRSPSPAPPRPGIGEAVIVRGTAFALNQAMKKRPIGPETRIFLHEVLETGPASRLKITLDDGSSLSQGENSRLAIDDYFYNPGKTSESRFAMRFMQGACRVVSGLITKVNPRQFKVRTRMATIGIRGCDVAFAARPDRDDIYILDISEKEHIRVDTTKDGRVLLNMATGTTIPPPDAVKTFVEVHKSRTSVSIIQGKGPQESTMTAEDFRKAVSETSHLSPAQYNLLQRPDGAVVTIQPRKHDSDAISDDQK